MLWRSLPIDRRSPADSLSVVVRALLPLRQRDEESASGPAGKQLREISPIDTGVPVV